MKKIFLLILVIGSMTSNAMHQRPTIKSAHKSTNKINSRDQLSNKSMFALVGTKMMLDKRSCTEEKFPGRVDYTRKIELLKEEIPQSVIDRYKRDFNVFGKSADATVEEWLKYMLLSKSKNIPLFSKKVDDFWHTFLIHNKKYNEFCVNNFNGIIYHNPIDQRKKESLCQLEEKNTFIEKYKECFGKDPLSHKDWQSLRPCRWCKKVSSKSNETSPNDYDPSVVEEIFIPHALTYDAPQEPQKTILDDYILDMPSSSYDYYDQDNDSNHDNDHNSCTSCSTCGSSSDD